MALEGRPTRDRIGRRRHYPHRVAHPEHRRELRQYRRGLPVEEKASVTVRAFVPGADEDAWLRVNNRAFRWHPEQGGWDRATLGGRQDEPWFDPAGFLLHEQDGRLAGFCWTKVHHHESAPLGEIYVLGVDPDFQGQGLGRELLLRGLEWLAAAGITTAMLYVYSDNLSALRMYEKLGFTLDHVDQGYLSGTRSIGDG